MLKETERKKIKKLEATIGKELRELPLENIFDYTNGYLADKEGNVTSLNLYKVKLTDISFLTDFPMVRHLDLSRNQIVNLSLMQFLTKLSKLNISENQITDLSPLQSLTNLTQLDLSRNQIIDISPLQSLTNLTQLDLIRNQIINLSSLQSLTNLTYLSLSYNQITDISPLQSLTNLTNLNLSSNQITELSPLQSLTNLYKLYLSRNQITDLSPLLPLKKLTRLIVEDNKISSIQPEWANQDLEIKWEIDLYDGIYLKGNPLETPPVEIVKQGNAAIRNYFDEIEKQEETVLLLHSKVLLVGSGAVGKTTLMKKLQDNTFEVIVNSEPTTHGINVVPWELSCTFNKGETHPVKIHFWDFGGQDIMYTTHQFFLTKRSLYLFVWEARQEGQEIASFDYWLNIIKLLSDNSPVIIVMNKVDSRLQAIDKSSLGKHFPNIRAFFQVSCLQNTGIRELTEGIRSCLADMPHLQDRLPKVWMEIRDRLKQLPDNYISFAKYLAICRKLGLDQERAEFLSDYLHDLGVILHFRNEPILADTVILNPEWATSAVYKIIDSKENPISKGRFHCDELKKIWDPAVFPLDKYPQLLRLMEKFELCFPVVGTGIHIVPELLPVEQPSIERDKYRRPESLCYEIHYNFMPRGIISRLITRLYAYIFKEHYWKNGVELVIDNTFGLVQSEPLSRKLMITVNGSEKSELLTIIRHHLEAIHRSLNMEKKEHYREMIPCRCSYCISEAKPHLFRHENLKRFQEKRIKEAQCQESGEPVSIAGLLKGYESPPQPNDLRNLLDDLIYATERLQGKAKNLQPNEDSYNTFVVELLLAKRYLVKDQMPWGSSASGKKPGEVDIMIETESGKAGAIIEAFNLKGHNSNVIRDHFQRIFKYDVNGLKANYLLVYVENANFGKLWDDYVNYLPDVELQYTLQGKPEEKETGKGEIRVACTKHMRNNRETSIYHIFINMGSHKGPSSV